MNYSKKIRKQDNQGEDERRIKENTRNKKTKCCHCNVKIINHPHMHPTMTNIKNTVKCYPKIITIFFIKFILNNMCHHIKYHKKKSIKKLE